MEEQIELGPLVYHILQLLDKFVRLHDLIAGGHFRFFHADLPIISASLRSEIEKYVGQLNSRLNLNIPADLPFENFDLNSICDNWWQDSRTKVMHLRFQIETSSPIRSGSRGMPENCVLLASVIDKKLSDYEFQRYKYDADTYKAYFDDQRRREQEEAVRRNSEFPDESFQFIKDRNTRLNLLLFYEELRSTYYLDSVRTPIILSGAIAEALLKEALLCEPERTRELSKLQQNSATMNNQVASNEHRPIEKWRFSDVIDVSLELGVLSRDLETQMDALRNFRNFIHIHHSAETAGQLDRHYKTICRSALGIVIR